MEQLLVVIGAAELSPADLDAVTRALRSELLELPVSDVQAVADGAAPPGSRGWDPTVVGELIVVMNSSAALLVSVVAAIRSWRRHTIPGSSIRLKLGEDEIELTGLSDESETRLLDDWTRRHEV
jgi:hypothetical protein